MPPARRVAVIFGGASPEHDVSVLTALPSARVLRASSAVSDVVLLYWGRNGSWSVVPGEPEAPAFVTGPPPGSETVDLIVGPSGGFFGKGRFGGRHEVRVDAALICCHGGPGEDGALQGALDLAGIAYSGPTAAGAALGMDKLASAAVLQAAGLPTLPRLALSDTSKSPDCPGPYIVKPRFGGSSLGIEVVEDFTTARARLAASVHLRRGAVLEPYRPELFDLQVALLSYPAPLLSAIERPTRVGRGEILDYADKYVAGSGMDSAERELPAEIPAPLAVELRALALATGELLGVRGVARVDFLSDGESLFVNEVNTVPGSLARHLFIDPPLAHLELLETLLVEAVARPAAEFSTAGADGTLLRDARSVAAKLG